MVQNERFYIIKKSDINKVDGDIKLLAWYSTLKDYSKRYRKDKTGFIRISPEIYKSDSGVTRRTIRRYNKRLEDKGLIEIDKTRRGGRTWAGFKLV